MFSILRIIFQGVWGRSSGSPFFEFFFRRISGLVFFLHAAFLLTVGSFLLTVELFYLQFKVDNFSVLLPIAAFLLTILAFFTYNWSFFAYNGKCV